MNPQPFIRWMYRLFNTLFYGQIGLYILGICFPFAINTIDWWEREITSKGTRIIYDTTATTSSVKTVSGETRDSAGRLTSRIQEIDGFLVKTDSAGRVLSKQSIDSIRKYGYRYNPELERYRQKQHSDIDSILNADPEAVIYKDRDGYSVHRSGSTQFAIYIPIAGGLVHAKRESAKDWRNTLSEQPKIELKQAFDSTAPYKLTISVSSWEQFKQAPLLLMLLGICRLLVYGISFLWVTYLFRQTFLELANNLYLSQSIWKRCRTIGWLFVGNFLLVNVLVNLSHAEAWRLLIENGYASWGQQPFLWPENWMWLWTGLILLAFAEALRYGSQLQQEHDLTV